jgi:hypothetical protein
MWCSLLTIPERYIPLRSHVGISVSSALLHFIASLLLLLVGLSLTIIKPIFLLLVRSTLQDQPPTSIATQLRFGVWGVCANRYVEIRDYIVELTLFFAKRV